MAGEQPARRPGQFKPGVSGNPGGRNRCHAKMAQMIRDKTRDGLDLVTFALEVWGGRVEGMTGEKSRQWAHDWLSERGFGKVLQTVEMTEPANPIPNLSTMTMDDLRRLAEEDDEDDAAPALDSGAGAP